MVGEAFLTAILEVVITSTVRPLRSLLTRWHQSSSPQVKNWLPRLNAYFNNEVLIFSQVRSEPVIRLKGRYALAANRQELANVQRLKLIQERRRNDPHAILTNQPKWQHDPVYLEAQTLYFSEVRAMRDTTLGNLRPEILSANALFFCSETQELILHQRSTDSDTFNARRRLHTLGGAYQPPDMDGTPADKLSLTNTARREVLEEAEAGLVWRETPPMILLKEVETGFIQLALLGIDIPNKEATRLVGSWEGEPIRVAFHDLPRALTTDESWVPPGKAAVLAWLALGAPNTKRRVKFGEFTPAKLFDLVVP